MYKSSIFQKNIVKHSDESEKALSFDNCQVQINNEQLIIKKNETELLNTTLKFLEEDFSTISFLGNYKNGIQFRVIRPTDLSLENLKSQFDCETAFSIASIDPSGYAIHFILSTPTSNPRVNRVIEKGEVEQIQKLINGSIMALQVDLQSNFIDFSKRILTLITDTTELSDYENSDVIIEVMRRNRHIYTELENKKII